MATSTPVRHAWRALTGLLVITALLFGINALGVYVFKASSWTPELALDLQGGTQIILEAQTADGAEPDRGAAQPGRHDHPPARRRLGRRRGRGHDRGRQQHRRPDPRCRPTSETRQRIEASAQLAAARRARTPAQPATTFVGDDGKETPYPTPDPSLEATPTAAPTNGSDLAWITPALQAEFLAYDCAEPDNDPAERAQPTSRSSPATPTARPSTSSARSSSTASSITDATFGLQQSQRPVGGQPQVRRRRAPRRSARSASASYGADGRRLNQFAFVLDGYVLSAPSMNARHPRRRPEHHRQLHAGERRRRSPTSSSTARCRSASGAVSSDTISATLGSQQLQIGLIAGLIGLALVAIYSLIVYRALGFVIIASLVVMGVLTYLTICILAWRMGFRLSLAGVAGLIVSIGFTADSFIVYFERIRDELRDGKSITGAVEDGWGRAKRTIYISKSINILAAVVLYILADATVKGFAFTLGLTTVDRRADLHPVHPPGAAAARAHEVLRRRGTRSPASIPIALGAVYRGRAQFRAPVAPHGDRRRAPRRQVARRGGTRQTIAERKQAEMAAATTPATTGTKPARPPRRETTDAAP